MRILVTGGAGFVGSHYVRTMLSGGYPGYEDAAVTVLDSLTYAGNLANLAPVSGSPRLRFVRGDIADPALVRSLVPGHDAVVNFATETHVDRSISGAAPFVATNVAGVQVLLQACLEAGVGPVVQVSTDEVYGSVASGSWTDRRRHGSRAAARNRIKPVRAMTRPQTTQDFAESRGSPADLPDRPYSAGRMGVSASGPARPAATGPPNLTPDDTAERSGHPAPPPGEPSVRSLASPAEPVASGPAGACCRQAHTGSNEASPRRVPALLAH